MPREVDKNAAFPALLVQRQAGTVPSDAHLNAWRSVWEPADDAAKFDPGMGDVEKLDLLLDGFRSFADFVYLGRADAFALQGDCTSLVKTFIALAGHIGVAGVKPGGHAGGNGWCISPGLQELGGRPPNMQGGDHDGAHYFNQHTWAEYDGVVYDVLFGHKGQRGREADQRKRLGLAGLGGVTHFCVDGEWYQAEAPTSNTYVPSAAPEAFGGASAMIGALLPVAGSGRLSPDSAISRVESGHRAASQEAVRPSV